MEQPPEENSPPIQQPPLPPRSFLRRHWPEIIAVSSLVLAGLVCMSTANQKLGGWIIYPLEWPKHLVRLALTDAGLSLCSIVWILALLIIVIAVICWNNRRVAALIIFVFAGIIMTLAAIGSIFNANVWLDETVHTDDHIYRLSELVCGMGEYCAVIYECDKFGILCHIIFREQVYADPDNLHLRVNEASRTLSLLAGGEVLYTTQPEE